MLALLLYAAIGADPPAAGDNKTPAKEPPNRIVLWNEHNGNEGNSGTAECNVYLLSASGSVIWKKAKVAVAWSPKEDKATVIEYRIGKNTKVGRVRVEVTKFHRTGGALAEIQVYRNGDLISEDSWVTASSEVAKGDRRNALTLTDGVTTSAKEYDGYALLALNQQGWFEVDLSRDRAGVAKAKR